MTLKNKKILFVSPKYYKGNLDYGFWNFYLPLKSICEVKFFDTSAFSEYSSRQEFTKIVELFKPDLIFSILTGDYNIAPLEPIEELKQIDDVVKLNWFCDDSWRFESFSKNLCKHFDWCVTTEPSYIDKYHEEGCENVLAEGWPVNSDFFFQGKKKYDISFVGTLYGPRKEYLEHLRENDIHVNVFSGVSYEDMTKIMSQSRILLSFSSNPNADPLRPYQIKGRLFESLAAGACLLTETTPQIEYFLNPRQEFLTFNNKGELARLCRKLLDTPRFVHKIAYAGHSRWRGSYRADVLLSSLLKTIFSLK